MTLSVLRSALSGYKTYVVALFLILVAVLEGALGIDLPYVEVPQDNWMQWAINGVLAITLRSGIAKAR